MERIFEPRALVKQHDGRRTAIMVGFGPWKKRVALLILMNSPICMEEAPIRQVDREWFEIEDYPAHRAAAIFLGSTSLPSEGKVVNALKEILVYYIVNKTAGTLEEAFPNKNQCNTAFGRMDEGVRAESVIAQSAEELKALSTPALVTLYNSVAKEDAQVKGFKSKDVGAERAFEALEAQYNPKVKAAAEKEAKAAAKAAEKEAKAAAKAAEKEAKGSKVKADPDGEYVPRPGSKNEKLLERLRKGNASLKDLSNASGFDEQNTRTSISILRSKKGVPVEYDKESKTYSLAA